MNAVSDRNNSEGVNIFPFPWELNYVVLLGVTHIESYMFYVFCMGAVDYGGCDYGECDYGECEYGGCDYSECEYSGCDYSECDYGRCVSVMVWPIGYGMG